MQVMATVILEECMVCLGCGELHLHGSKQLAYMGAVLLDNKEQTRIAMWKNWHCKDNVNCI